MSKVTNLLLAVGILLTGCLSGCIPSAPQGLPAESSAVSGETASATPIATPTPTPVPTPAALGVDADGLTVVASDGSVLADIPYTTPVAAVAEQLTGFLGAEPVIEDFSGDGICSGPHSTFDWEGFQLRSPPSGFADGEFSIRVGAPTTLGGVSLHFSDGLRVGSSMAELLDSPLVQVASDVIYFDVRGDLSDTSGDSNPYGGYVSVTADVVTQFSAPSNYYYDC